MKNEFTKRLRSESSAIMKSLYRESQASTFGAKSCRLAVYQAITNKYINEIPKVDEIKTLYD